MIQLAREKKSIKRENENLYSREFGRLFRARRRITDSSMIEMLFSTHAPLANRKRFTLNRLNCESIIQIGITRRRQNVTFIHRAVGQPRDSIRSRRLSKLLSNERFVNDGDLVSRLCENVVGAKGLTRLCCPVRQ